MRARLIKLAAISIMVAIALPFLLLKSDTSSNSEKEMAGLGLGSVESLETGYNEWEALYIKDGGDRNMVLPIGSFKGLSTEDSNAHGQAKLNLIDGSVSVEIENLPETESWDVWLVENRSGAGRTVMPEEGDGMLRLGSLKIENGIAKLVTNLGKDAFTNFEPELVVVGRTGKNPVQDRLLVGTTTLYHRLYRSKQKGHFGVLGDTEETAKSTAE